MIDYIFPVEYKFNNHWDEGMILDWKSSHKQFLSFSFNRFDVHTLPNNEFWLYLYYTKSRSDEIQFQGKLRFKFHVIQWTRANFLESDTTFVFPSTLPATIWFLCDHCNKASTSTGALLDINDFQHPKGKILTSCLRNSISPAICMVGVKEMPMV